MNKSETSGDIVGIILISSLFMLFLFLVSFVINEYRDELENNVNKCKELGFDNFRYGREDFNQEDSCYSVKEIHYDKTSGTIKKEYCYMPIEKNIHFIDWCD
ncbi:MAG: hypothetical protein ACOCVF_02935 [bacterium]